MSSVSKPLEATGPIEARNANQLVARDLAEGRLVGDLDRTWHSHCRLPLLRQRFQHPMVGGDAGEVVGFIGTRVRIFKPTIFVILRSFSSSSAYLLSH